MSTMIQAFDAAARSKEVLVTPGTVANERAVPIEERETWVYGARDDPEDPEDLGTAYTAPVFGDVVDDDDLESVTDGVTKVNTVCLPARLFCVTMLLVLRMRPDQRVSLGRSPSL